MRTVLPNNIGAVTNYDRYLMTKQENATNRTRNINGTQHRTTMPSNVGAVTNYDRNRNANTITRNDLGINRTADRIGTTAQRAINTNMGTTGYNTVNNGIGYGTAGYNTMGNGINYGTTGYGTGYGTTNFGTSGYMGNGTGYGAPNQNTAGNSIGYGTGYGTTNYGMTNYNMTGNAPMNYSSSYGSTVSNPIGATYNTSSSGTSLMNRF